MLFRSVLHYHFMLMLSLMLLSFGLSQHLSKLSDKTAAHRLCLASLASAFQTQHMGGSFVFLCLVVVGSMDQQHQHNLEAVRNTASLTLSRH